jgi:hypothetical protein
LQIVVDANTATVGSVAYCGKNGGHAPTLIEPVKGWLVLKDLEGPVEIRLVALDGAGRPMGEQIRGRRLEIDREIPLGERATTVYVVHLIRSAEQFERVQAMYRE